MSPDRCKAIARIVKVNHAGENGAIRIYGAQITVANLLWPKLVPTLTELRRHEIEHCRQFKNAMPARQTRPCRIMPLWSIGGWVLGFLTALLGPKAIWACTEVVEETVHRHLSDQISFLDGRDPDLRQIISDIQVEEAVHLSIAKNKIGVRTRIVRLLAPVISASVESAIWLSTWGDSARMRHDLEIAS